MLNTELPGLSTAEPPAMPFWWPGTTALLRDRLPGFHSGGDRDCPAECLAACPLDYGDRQLLWVGRDPGDVFALSALCRAGHQIAAMLGKLRLAETLEVPIGTDVARRESGLLRRTVPGGGLPDGLPAGQGAVATAGAVCCHCGRDGSPDGTPDVHSMHELRLSFKPRRSGSKKYIFCLQPGRCPGMAGQRSGMNQNEKLHSAF